MKKSFICMSKFVIVWTWEGFKYPKNTCNVGNVNVKKYHTETRDINTLAIFEVSLIAK